MFCQQVEGKEQKNCWKFFGVEYVQRAELCGENYDFRNMRMYEFSFLIIFKIVIFGTKNLYVLKVYCQKHPSSHICCASSWTPTVALSVGPNTVIPHTLTFHLSRRADPGSEMLSSSRNGFKKKKKR